MAAAPLALALVALLAPATSAQAAAPAPAAGPARPAPLAAIALSIRSRAIQDSRCYLMNGGAVESFFISEDTPVGSVIGTLSVNGDASEDGDISLRLQEAGAAVGVAPGTKNLTLLRALDREEARGPSNVYVNVRCDRRRTTDPSFIIPVSVRVWDVNDNAPTWVNAPYRVRLSELTAVGARVLHPRASDADQPGPHATIHYSVLPSPHSEYLGFLNELDSVLVVKKPLDFETLRNFTLRLRAQDQGTPPLHSDAALEVEVLDADDQNPKFSSEHYTATIPDDAQPGTFLETSPGPIFAKDQDLGINAPLQYAATGDQRRLVDVDRDSGRVAVTEELLQQPAPITVVIKATQVDNPDRYALATLSLSRLATAAPARAVRFTQRRYDTTAAEDTPPGARLLTLHTDPPAHTSSLQFYVSDRSFLDKFAINSAGEVLLRRALDFEAADAYHYQVMVTDGDSNDTASINITVLNVNEWEPRFRYPQYEFHVDGEPAPGALLPVGRLDVFDGDKPDTVALTLRGPDASMLQVNELGEVFLRADRLSALNTSVLHALATAQDSGAPPRQTSVPLLVHVGPRLLAAAEAGGGGALLAACACALALLALLVCALLLYIYRNKRKSKAAAVQSKTASGYVNHEKLRPTGPVGGAGGPVAQGGAGPGLTGGLAATAERRAAGAAGGLTAGGSGSLLSVSAGASTILANSTSSLDLRAADTPGTTSARQSQRFPNKSKVAPLPPASAAGAGAGAGAGAEGGVSLMSDHLRGLSAGRSGVAWPAHTIPARVKQLSWDERPQVGDSVAAACTPSGTGQRGGGQPARRHQHRALGPHEPDSLLLSGDQHAAPRDTAAPQNEYIPMRDLTKTHDYYNISAQNNEVRPDNKNYKLPNSENETDQHTNSNGTICDTRTPSDEIRHKQIDSQTKYKGIIKNSLVPYNTESRSEQMPTRGNLSTQNTAHPFSVAMMSPRQMQSHTNPHLPVEIIPIQIVSDRHRSPTKKSAKSKIPKTLPLSARRVVATTPEPIAYIPVQLNHPPVNPEFLSMTPKTSNKPRALKKSTPPGQARSPVEYVSISLANHPLSNPYEARVGSPQYANHYVSVGAGAAGAAGRGPSAPRLSATSASLEGAFASIDPRKLRAQRVSPLIFTRTYQRYRML